MNGTNAARERGTCWSADAIAATAAICRLANANAVVVWNADGGLASSPHWTPTREAVASGRELLSTVSAPSTMSRADERLEPLVGSCPEECSSLVYVPVGPGGSGALLAFGQDQSAPEIDMEALGGLAVLAVRPSLDQKSLIGLAQLASAGQMATTVAHDVGTPLNVISGYAEYLLMSAPSEAPSHKGLSTILDQTRRIAQMIRQVLDVVRPSSAPGFVQRPLGEFMDDVLHMTSYSLRKAEVKAHVEGQDAAVGVSIHGNPSRLLQAMFAVLVNGARTVGPGGKLTLYLVGDKASGGGVEIVGSDAKGAVADLGELVAWDRSPDIDVCLGSALAGQILENYGGGLEETTVDGQARVLVRFGAAPSRPE